MKGKVFTLAALAAFAMVLASCQKEHDPKNPTGKDGLFDFATSTKCDVTIDYKLTGYNTGIEFQIYAENPYRTVIDENGGPVLETRNDVKAIGKGVTTVAGRFTGKIKLPTYVKEVFIVTDYAVSHNLVRIPVVNNTINADFNNLPAQESVSANAASRASHTVPAGFYTLGDWTVPGGVPDYIGHEDLPKGLLSDLRNVLLGGRNVSNTKYSYLVSDEPGVYRNHNINLVEASELTMTFLTSAASWNNVVGYYHYPTATPPSSPADIARKTIAFPRTSGTGRGLMPGDNAKLKYWNGTEYVDKFPAGTTVGFVIIPGGFNATTGNIAKVDYAEIAYSDAALNLYGKAAYQNCRQQTVALYDYAQGGRNLVVIGFEDRTRGIYSAKNDHDFDDVVFYIKSNPIQAIEIPDDHKPGDIDPNDPTPGPQPYYVDYSGTLIFEDLWPNRGDYDLNDVGITYDCRVWYNTDNKVFKVEDSFTPVRKGAAFECGFGYQYGVAPSAIASMVKSSNNAPVPSFDLDQKGLELGQSLATVMLFDNIKTQVEGAAFARKAGDVQTSKYTYNIVTTFATPMDIDQIGLPPYNPFIVVNRADGSDVRNREVHLANHRPTDLAYGKDGGLWFGRYHDASNEAKGLWYICGEENYPFAIDVPTKTFEFPLESVKIYEVYPKFTTWARTHGAQNANWYIK